VPFEGSGEKAKREKVEGKKLFSQKKKKKKKKEKKKDR